MKIFSRRRTLRAPLGAALSGVLVLSLVAPGLHASPGDPMGCAGHHALTAGTVLAPVPQGTCAAMPDACRLMLGCGAVAPVPVGATPVLTLAPPARAYHPVSTRRFAGLPGHGPPTPPPNS